MASFVVIAPVLSVALAILGLGAAWGAIRRAVSGLEAHVEELRGLALEVASMKPQLQDAREEVGHLREITEETRLVVEALRTDVKHAFSSRK